MNSPGSIGHVPPHNEEAEQALLGALLLDGSALTRVEDLIKSEDLEDLYNRRHSIIYETIRTLVEQDTEIDLVSLTQKLRQEGTLEKAGGASYLAALTEVVASSANIRYYADIIRDCSVRVSYCISQQL